VSFPAAFNPENSRGSAPLHPIPPKNLQPLNLDVESHAPRFRPDQSGWQRRTITRRVDRGRGRNVLIVGAGPLGRKLADTLQREHIDGRIVVGFLDESETVTGDGKPGPDRAQ
jgi:hypothetical protein